MSTSQLIVTRFSDLLAEGSVEAALRYIAEDVVYNTWMGIVYGRENVSVFLHDNVRFLHHGRNYNRWKQVQHSLDPTLGRFDRLGSSEPAHGEPWSYFDADGYDSQGYATFERDGTISSHAKFSVFSVRVKETIVLRRNRVVLVNLSKRA
ncbi:hypothetical protein ERJ75_000739500 [Trypanosoma vivax]|uniref:SnoaL-like domain-containing protein n=1 Tax=Trypanosoma vivax (strain Y486) TaxID=1055687 RepID=G0TXF6_TRYVY|nr:hypothetical protein TRVL_02282 [Trypanosoma vivax]KAH8613869.1 hypothetical protein ERJ75_000739500 [Trypanosoma vivax]CCC48646.1 conserved hypothetical protein [Trypanosoma vivax Y486]